MYPYCAAIGLLTFSYVSSFALVSAQSNSSNTDADVFTKLVETDIDALFNGTLADSDSNETTTAAESAVLATGDNPNAWYERALNASRYVLATACNSDHIRFRGVTLRPRTNTAIIGRWNGQARVKMSMFNFPSNSQQQENPQIYDLQNDQNNNFLWHGGLNPQIPPEYIVAKAWSYDTDVVVRLDKVVEILTRARYRFEWKVATLWMPMIEPGMEGPAKVATEPWWGLGTGPGNMLHWVNAKTGRVVGPAHPGVGKGAEGADGMGNKTVVAEVATS